MIDAEIGRLWEAYLQSEKEHVRETMISSLNHFVERFGGQPDSDRRNWAFNLARAVVDDKKDIPVRFPLFRRVLLPALIDGILGKQPGCARWLAEFESLLFHSAAEAERLPESLKSRVGLLEEALRIDPCDERARNKWIDCRSSYLDYTIHELPTGVLYGSDGATISQCDELIELLKEFRKEIDTAGRSKEFEELVEECDFHYDRYRAYLELGRPNGSYEEFLDSYRKEG